MDIHKNARLTFRCRGEMVRRVLEDGQPPKAVASAFDATVNHAWEADRENHVEQVRAWPGNAFEARDSLAAYAEKQTRTLRAA